MVFFILTLLLKHTKKFTHEKQSKGEKPRSLPAC